jgi:hypothetical protein
MYVYVCMYVCNGGGGHAGATKASPVPDVEYVDYDDVSVCMYVCIYVYL